MRNRLLFFSGTLSAIAVNGVTLHRIEDPGLKLEEASTTFSKPEQVAVQMPHFGLNGERAKARRLRQMERQRQKAAQ